MDVRLACVMEHQDSVTWPFFGIIGAYVAFVVGYSIYSHSALVLVWGFGILLGGAIVWGSLALLNIVMFPPLFRLLARLTGGKKTQSEDRDDRA